MMSLVHFFKLVEQFISVAIEYFDCRFYHGVK